MRNISMRCQYTVHLKQPSSAENDFTAGGGRWGAFGSIWRHSGGHPGKEGIQLVLEGGGQSFLLNIHPAAPRMPPPCPGKLQPASSATTSRPHSTAPCFIVLLRCSVFYTWNVCGSPALSKSVCTIFVQLHLFTSCLCITFWCKSHNISNPPPAKRWWPAEGSDDN